MEEATYLASCLVSIESVNKMLNLSSMSDYEAKLRAIFISSYILSIGMVFLDVKSSRFYSQNEPLIRTVVKVLHGSDCLCALLLGVGLWLHSLALISISCLLLTKFFLLHLLSRAVTGVKTTDKLSMCIETTKAYLHHMGNFLFIGPEDYVMILITTIWRFLSLTGHLAIYLSEDSVISKNFFFWQLSFCRNAAIMILLLLCHCSSSIRSGFAISAVGHISYLIVRMGPVFRLGSFYLETDDKIRWQDMTDYERFVGLCSMRHPYLALELVLLALLGSYLMCLNVTEVVHGRIQSAVEQYVIPSWNAVGVMQF